MSLCAKGIIWSNEKPEAEINFVDVGAGTGIWSRMVYEKGVKTATAVEPNDDMRASGIVDSKETDIKWLAGSAENQFVCDFRRLGLYGFEFSLG